MKVSTVIASLALCAPASAFVPASRPAVPTSVEAGRFFPFGDDGDAATSSQRLAAGAAAAAAALASSPLAALAEEADDYEYGAVNAPGGLTIAVVGGVLAILTAAVPVVLAPGEDAFNEMRERDGDFSKDFDPRKNR